MANQDEANSSSQKGFVISVEFLALSGDRQYKPVCRQWEIGYQQYLVSIIQLIMLQYLLFLCLQYWVIMLRGNPILNMKI